MSKNKNLPLFPPLVFNVFKPARITSYDVIRHFKRHLPSGYGKIGHFGTLDPFASGVLLIGICGAARLNDYIHDFLPKTYLAVGKLGIETPTGDYESAISQRDDSLYLKQEIARFPATFIENRLREKFLGDYLQAPHKYSASKFMGRNLHEWAREGIEVKKEAVLRTIYDIEVVKYAFPYLSIRVTVSSGTYVRTLFSDMANDLGTIGSLISLVREKIGELSSRNALKKGQWPMDKNPAIMEQAYRVDKILPFNTAVLDETQVKGFKNGAFLKPDNLKINVIDEGIESLLWMTDEQNHLLGLAQQTAIQEVRPKINFNSEATTDSSSGYDQQ
jgi:tRNA pseudouridine55 synthase